MTKVMTDESNYLAIASQIRSKLGVSTRYKPSEMAAAIGSISGVSSADNGKVVVDGQLTQQTSRSVSQNGTYDTTTNNEVVVNVSGGGGGGSSIDLNVIADFTPNVQTGSVKSGGFSIAPLVDITIDKLLIFPNSATSVNAYIEDSNGNSVASVTGASVTARTWNEVSLQNPIKLKEDETYVIWYDEGGQLLYAVSGNPSPNLGSLASVTSLYATSIAKPTVHESARYGINAHASYIGEVSGGGSTNILSGTSAPSASDGDDGDVYMRYSRGGVRNTIGQYINTGYSGGNSSKYVIEFSFDGNQNDQYPTPFGGRSASGSITNASSIHFQASSTLYGWGSAQQTVNVGYGTADGSLTRIELSAGSFKIEKQNGSNSYTFTPTSISATTPIGIFALLANGSVVSGCRAGNMTLYSFEIYESDMLVHKFVPAIDGNDVACVYDEVADEYKYHTGSGSLEYIEEGTIVGTYLKVNGSWLPLIGQDIDDVNIGS